MSIVNLKAKCEDAKIMKDRTTELKTNLTSVSERVNNLTRLVETLKIDNNETFVKLDNKADAFLLDVLSNELEQQKAILNDIKEIIVTKDEFAANLDEISKCFESYILTTPRIKSPSDDTIAKRIDELEVTVAALNRHNQELEAKQAIVDSATRSVPDVPVLEINKVTVFKQPQKRVKPTA